jgi:hypothetical protein
LREPSIGHLDSAIEDHAAWTANDPFSFVIPAPFASEARKRDQAGTQTADKLLSDRQRTLWPALLLACRGNVALRTSIKHARCAVHGSRPGPTRALSGTRDAGMTIDSVENEAQSRLRKYICDEGQVP